MNLIKKLAFALAVTVATVPAAERRVEASVARADVTRVVRVARASDVVRVASEVSGARVARVD